MTTLNPATAVFDRLSWASIATARMVCLPSFSVARAVLPQACSFCLSNAHRKCTGGETLPGSCELRVNATCREVCVRLPRITGFVGGVRSSYRIRPCRLLYCRCTVSVLLMYL